MILKYKSSLLKSTLHAIKLALISKIRYLYSKKLHDRLFVLASIIDSKLNKNELKITINSDNLDEYSEYNKKLNHKPSWFISKELRSRAIKSYIKKGILFSGKRLEKNYSLQNIIFN